MSGNLRPGAVFGRLTVVGPVLPGSRADRVTRRVPCECTCGGRKVVAVRSLEQGLTKSCGCISREAAISRNLSHGLCGLPEYAVWSAMRARCNNPRNKAFCNYGARGIRVDPRWDDFGLFISDMGRRPEGLTLERLDNDGDYTPGNCIWATRDEQARNRRVSVAVEVRGVLKTVSDLSRETGTPASTIYWRISRGLPPLGASAQEQK